VQGGAKVSQCLAYRDHRLDEGVVYASTQTPHTMRVALGELLGQRRQGIC
jgi:hypothetical protein